MTEDAHEERGMSLMSRRWWYDNFPQTRLAWRRLIDAWRELRRVRSREDAHELTAYVRWLEGQLDSVDDGNLFGCYGWRFHLPSKFKSGPKLRHWGENV